MKIGVIGAGNVGLALSKNLVRDGHDLFLSFSRSNRKLEETAQLIGESTQFGSVSDAADFGELVILATPFNSTSEAIKLAGDKLNEKIVWDCTNPVKADLSGLEIGTFTSAGEEVQRMLPNSFIVKAIPPFANELMSGTKKMINGVRRTVFVCGNSINAKRIVIRLIGRMGANGIDVGPLSNSRYVEPACYLLVNMAFILGKGTQLGYYFLDGSGDIPEKTMPTLF